MRPSCVQLAIDVLRLAARGDPHALARAVDLASAVLDDAALLAGGTAASTSRSADIAASGT
jgi:hypothetical protein